MRPVAWMIGAGMLSWLATVALVGAATGVAVLLGMIGPLAMATATWVLAERTYRHNPGRLTSLMVAAFAGKMVFFAAYVAVMLKALSLAPAPFAASFAVYFIALHLFEALSLRAMFAGDGL